MRAILITLYLITAFAKLNNGWHDPSHLRLLQRHVFIGVVGHFLSSDVVRLIPPTLLSIMPHFATYSNWASRQLCSSRYDTSINVLVLVVLAGTLPLRCLTIAGSAFHVLISPYLHHPSPSTLSPC